jgi:hypothetical protein
MTDISLNDLFSDFDRTIDDFHGALHNWAMLNESSKRTSGEEMLLFLGPFLLAIALALRITKVTGEIRLET